MGFDPSTLGAGAKTRLHTPKAVTYHEQYHTLYIMIGHSLGRMESRIKERTPHCICRPGLHQAGVWRCGTARQSQYLIFNITIFNITIFNTAHICFQKWLQAQSGVEMCFGPSTLETGAKPRRGSRIKKLTPHMKKLRHKKKRKITPHCICICICRPRVAWSIDPFGQHTTNTNIAPPLFCSESR